MLRLLLNQILRRTSLRFLYLTWIRTSAAALFLWAALSLDNQWFALSGLTMILVVLLVSGILLLALGVKDLVRDFWNLLHAPPH
jgi:hypothetical protein